MEKAKEKKKSDLERTLEVFCKGSFKNEPHLQSYFSELGRAFYSIQFKKHRKQNNQKISENYALVNLVDYLIDKREKILYTPAGNAFNSSLKILYILSFINNSKND